MVILRTRNKITDFLMILAWASPFNQKVLIDKEFNIQLNMPQYVEVISNLACKVVPLDVQYEGGLPPEIVEIDGLMGADVLQNLSMTRTVECMKGIAWEFPKGRTIWFLGGGGPRLLLSVMFFFSKKLAHNFFFLHRPWNKHFFCPWKKNKTFFCDSSYLIKYVDKCHALTLMKVSLWHTYSSMRLY